MALSDFTGPDGIGAWTADLDRSWPERAAMADCVVRTLVGWRAAWSGGGPGKDGPDARIRLLELGFGAGELARTVLSALSGGSASQRTFVVEYTGIEIEQDLVLHGRKSLTAAGHPDARLIRADLKGDSWTRESSAFDAVFTLQTLHDLGGVDALASIYRKVHGVLTPGGLLANADFIAPFAKDDPDRPRRFPVETHLELLSDLGYTDFHCVLSLGKMACMSARRP